MNGVHKDSDAPLAGTSSPYAFSDDGVDEDHHDDHPGDYSTRFEELMSDGEHEHEDSDEEGFLYNGVDADQVQGGYKEQLRDVLGPDHEEDASVEEEVEVERSLIHDVEENEKFAASLDDEARVRHTLVVSSLFA